MTIQPLITAPADAIFILRRESTAVTEGRETAAGLVDTVRRVCDALERGLLSAPAPADNADARRLSFLQAHVVSLEAQHRALVRGLLDACSQVVRSSSMHTSIKAFAGMLANAVEGAQATEGDAR
jgi:hypothetical protein